jgi:hypothetical protein
MDLSSLGSAGHGLRWGHGPTLHRSAAAEPAVLVLPAGSSKVILAGMLANLCVESGPSCLQGSGGQLLATANADGMWSMRAGGVQGR